MPRTQEHIFEKKKDSEAPKPWKRKLKTNSLFWLQVIVEKNTIEPEA